MRALMGSVRALTACAAATAADKLGPWPVATFGPNLQLLRRA